MIETEAAHGIRLERNSNLNEDILRTLERSMKDNCLAEAYMMLKDQLKIEEKKAAKEGTMPPP